MINITHNKASFDLLVNFVHCTDVSGYIRLNDERNQMQRFNVNEITFIFFEQLTPLMSYNLEIVLVLPSGQIVNIGYSSFSSGQIVDIGYSSFFLSKCLMLLFSICLV